MNAKNLCFSRRCASVRFPLVGSHICCLYKMRSKYNNGASCYSVTTNPSLVVATSPLLRHFVSMNYQNKEILYEVKNMTAKYLDISCSDATKPFDKLKMTRGYRYLKWEKILGIKTTRFLASTPYDQLPRDCRMGRKGDPVRLSFRSWWRHYKGRLL
jgi:hypothetical protein